MGNRGVLTEIGSLMWSHPYVSCSLLVFLTPPFLPILKYFSPLLISTALFVVALVTLGPHFEPPLDEEDEFLVNAAEFKASGGAGFGREDGERDVLTTKPSKDVRSSWSDWTTSWKEAAISWVQEKLQNENWKGSSLNDDNVSILEEAFAHRAAQEKSQVMSKLATRRIRAGDEATVVEEPELQSHAEFATPASLSHSDSWTSNRMVRHASFSTGSSSTRDLPHSFFSPHPSFSRRQDSDVNPLFENVIPPPIEYDMPPLITGPASITDPLFKSLEEDMDTSDDESDHHHCDHDLLEVGESTVDADPVIPHNETPNGTHHQPSDERRSASPETLNIEAPESSPTPTHGDANTSVTETHEESASPVDSGHTQSPAEDQSVPGAEERSVPTSESHQPAPQGETSHPSEELRDVPELEDEQPVENASRELNPTEVLLTPSPEEPHDNVPATPEEPTHRTTEILSAPTDDLAPHGVVERSTSLPILTELEPLPDSAPRDNPPTPPEPSTSLTHAVSLPASLHPIPPINLPPPTTDQSPLSPDPESKPATTLDHEGAQPLTLTQTTSPTEAEPHSPKPLATTDNALTMEPPSNSLPTTPAAPATEEISNPPSQATEETDSASKAFQPDAPELQITPPTPKVVLALPPPPPSPPPSSPPPSSSSPAAALQTRSGLAAPPLSSKSFKSQYSSSDEESGDEEIDLDSDVEVVGEDSDSDFDEAPPLVRLQMSGLKASTKPPAEHVVYAAPAVAQA